MFKFKSRLKTHISLIIILLSVLVIPANVKGDPSMGFVEHAVNVLTSGKGYSPKAINRAKGILTAHINDLNKLRLDGKISNAQYQSCQRSFYNTNNPKLKNSSTPRIKISAPEHPGAFNPGTDTDAIATVRNKGDRIKLKDIEQVTNKYQNNIRKSCQNNGYDPSPGKIDTNSDIMADPDCTSPREHAKIAKWINDNGGCAYSSQNAVRAEIKLGKGQNVNLSEAAAYQAEMGEQVNKQFKLSKNAKTPVDSQLHNSLAAKYIKRSATKLDANLRNQHLSTPHRTDITGIDAAIEEITAGGRGPQTKMSAAKVKGLLKHALQKTRSQYINTHIEIAHAYGSKTGMARAAGKNIAQELVNLSPSEANVMIKQMENQLGHEFTTKTVQDAKKIRSLNNSAETAGQKFLRRAGYAMIAYDAGCRLYDVYSAKYEDRPQKFYEEFDAFILGTSGAFAGAAAGAAFGTLICPGPGTAVGTIFGLFWGAKGYMEGDAWGHKIGSQRASELGINQDVGRHEINKATNTLFGGLIAKGIPQAEAEEATKLFHSGKLKELKQYMANLRKKYITKTTISEIMDSENFSNKERLKILNCLCEGCGTMSGYYSPEYKGTLGYGNCRCDGSYNTYKKPLRMDKKTMYACINNVLRARYDKSQANFDEMHKETEAAYQEMLEIARRENAKSVQKEVQEVKQLMQKDETLIKAAKLFNDIKELLLKQARNKLSGDLWLKLQNAAGLKVVTGELDKAVDLTVSANKVRDFDPEKSSDVAQLKRMRDNWSKARSELFPKIIKKIDAGNLAVAKSMLKDLDLNMGGMNPKYPYAYKDPKYIALKEKLKKKEKELQNAEDNKKSENKFVVIHKKIATFNGELTNAKPVDSHVIKMPVNGTLNLKITTGPKLNFYNGIQLLDSDNKTSISRDIGQGPDSTKTWSFSLLRAGTYHLKMAKDSRNFYYGPYSVEVSIDTQKFASDRENNDNFATANTLHLNQTVTGHLGARGQEDDSDQVDYWKLTMPTEGELHLYLTTSKKLNLNGGVYIYGSNQNLIHRWSHGSDTNKTYKSKKLKAGTYYIKIEKDGRNFYWGSYHLNIRLLNSTK